MATKPDWNVTAREGSRSESGRLWRRFTDRLQAQLFERWAPEVPVRRLLKTDLFDEAVSEGLLPSLGRHAKSVVGIDVSMAAPAEARRRYPGGSMVAADVRGLPFEDGSFDYVLSGSTLDHFDDLGEVSSALGELCRVLRPRGRMLLTMDNLRNPLVWLRDLLPFSWLNRIGLVPYYVGRTTGPSGLRRLVEAAGFEIVDAAAVLHCPRVPAVAMSRLLEGRASLATQDGFVRSLLGFERLDAWPTRYLTAYFNAILVEKPDIGPRN